MNTQDAPNTPTLQERKQELVRAELASAAWKLFGQRGYEATTVTEIAAAAGVSRRTFFRYYSSKEDVLVEATDELAESMLASMAERPIEEPPLVAIERALISRRGATLDFEDLPESSASAVGGTPGTFDDAARRAILDALAATGGRIYGPFGAAARLGIPPSTLQGKMLRLGINRSTR